MYVCKCWNGGLRIRDDTVECGACPGTNAGGYEIPRELEPLINELFSFEEEEE